MANIKLAELQSASITELPEQQMTKVVGGYNRRNHYFSFSVDDSFNTQLAINISTVVQIGDDNFASVSQNASNFIG